MPNKNIFDVVLLFALPASGKSEVRRYMANISPKKLSEEFHIGDNLQLDDFPYVFMMRRIDEELLKLGRRFLPGRQRLGHFNHIIKRRLLRYDQP